MPKKSVDIETEKLVIKFNDGQTEEFFLTEIPDSLRNTLCLHGLSQKLGDSYAGKPDDAYEAVMTVWENLCAGNWTVRGEGGTRISYLVKALCRLDEALDVDEVKAKVAELSKDEKKAIERNPRIQSVIAEIKLEEAQRKADAASGNATADASDILSLFG